jgi:tyrosine-protein phosphatase YwqE
MGLFSFLFKNEDTLPSHLGAGLSVDMHSHFIPGIDDGCVSIDETLEMARAFVDFGFKKIITTPHIISDLHPNTPESILNGCKQVHEVLLEHNIPLEIEAAAEYFFDEDFLEKISRKEPLLTFGHRYLLFETPMMNEPIRLKEALFELRIQGYKPVMAHPERYNYFFHNFELLEELFDGGLLLQMNVLSLIGHYGLPQQKLAEKLIDKNMISWLGTDCHRPRHLERLREAYKSKLYNKCLGLDLLNNKLLNNGSGNTQGK